MWPHARRRDVGRVPPLAAHQRRSRAASRAQATTPGKAGRTGLLRPGPRPAGQEAAGADRAAGAGAKPPPVIQRGPSPCGRGRTSGRAAMGPYARRRRADSLLETAPWRGRTAGTPGWHHTAVVVSDTGHGRRTDRARLDAA